MAVLWKKIQGFLRQEKPLTIRVPLVLLLFVVGQIGRASCRERVF